jgi:predicted nucleotidyltransferase
MTLPPMKSKVTRAILGYFFLNPEETAYINELARKLRLDKRNLVRKLKELEGVGLLRSSHRGNLKLYSLNKIFPLLKEYEKIVLSTFGLEGRLRDILTGITGIKKAFLFGSFSRGRQDAWSDVDLLVIGDHSIRDFQRAIKDFQVETNREVNAVHMSEEEWEKKMNAGDPFLKHLFDRNPKRLIG